MGNTDIGQKVAIGILALLLVAFTGGFVYYHFRGEDPAEIGETSESLSSVHLTSSLSSKAEESLSAPLQSWTAETVAAWLQGQTEKVIGEVVVYTAQTDPEQLMGLPGEYVSKVRFEDLRLEQPENAADCAGGAIEVFSFPEDAKKRKKQVEELASEETKPVILIKDCILMYLNEQFSLEMLSEYSEIFMDLPAAPPEGLKLVNPVYLNRESNLFKTVTDSYAVTVEREYHGVAFHVPAAWVSEDKNVFYPSNATQITISFLETLNPYMDYVFGMVEEDMEGVEERLSCRMLIGENFCEYRSVYHIDDGRMYQSDMVLLLSKREEGHVAFCLTQPVAGTEDYTADFFQLLTSCTVLGNVKEPPAEENEEIGGESLSQQIAASAASSSSESSSSLSWEEMLERLDSLS